MKYLIIIYFSLFVFSFSFGQNTPPVIQWQKSFGGSGIDVATSILQTNNGGFIFAGYSYSNDGDVTGHHNLVTNISGPCNDAYLCDSSDYWVVKLDLNGNIQWKKCIGGSSQDYAYSIQKTTNGGYIVIGFSRSNDGNVTGHYGNSLHNRDYWIVKLDSIGNIQWQKILGGTGDDTGASIQQTTDGGYIIAGASDSFNGDVSGHHAQIASSSGYGMSDYWVVKIDSVGNLQWQKCLGGSDDDIATSVQQTNDGGYIVAGHTISNDGDVTGNIGNGGCWIVKLNSIGNIQWEKYLGGGSYFHARTIQQTNDGGYVVGNSGYIFKIDSIGNIQWQYNSLVSVTGWDYSNAIQQTSDNGYVFAQSTYGYYPGFYGDYLINKIDSAGNIQWQKTLGGTVDDKANSVQQTIDGGFIVAGYSSSNDGDVTLNHGDADCWIVKLSPVTNISGTFTYNNTLNTPLDSLKVYLMQNGNKLDSTQTDTSGHYQFNYVANGAYNITATTHKAWGGVNVTDAIKVKQHFSGSQLLTSSIKLHSGDVNNTMVINTTDAIRIMKRYSGADTSFVRGDWVFEKPYGGDTINVSTYMNDTVIVNGANVVQPMKGLCVGDVNGSYNSIPIGQKSFFRKVRSQKFELRSKK